MAGESGRQWHSFTCHCLPETCKTVGTLFEPGFSHGKLGREGYNRQVVRHVVLDVAQRHKFKVNQGPYHRLWIRHGCSFDGTCETKQGVIQTRQ